VTSVNHSRVIESRSGNAGSLSDGAGDQDHADLHDQAICVQNRADTRAMREER
jgi:hypothetical protein